MTSDHRQHKSNWRNGGRKGFCRHCGEPVTPPRTYWHKECWDWVSLEVPGALRGKIQQRDKGVCSKCGLSMNERRDLLRSIRKISISKSKKEYWKDNEAYGGWQADHIVALKDGGSLGLWNVQTLCGVCHKEKTKKEAHERAKKRRAEKQKEKQESFLEGK